MTRWLAAGGLLCSMLFTTGCGESVAPSRGVAVSGKITMGGKPLAGADVSFLNETFVGFAKTDEEGNYKLVQGAAPGSNKISISKFEGGAAPSDPAMQLNPEAGIDEGQLEAAAAGWGQNNKNKPVGPKQLVPEEYSSASKTKLTFDVPVEGASGVNFDL